MPSIGDTFKLGPGGSYRLVACIGKSSFGEIWSALWLENQHPVAIKFVRRDHLDQASPPIRASLIESLQKEIDFLRRIRAGHLLRLHRSGFVDGLPVMVLEHLSGDLHQHLQVARRLPLSHALEWLRQIAEGLRALHYQGWRHLDLKPHNLLLGACGTGVPRLRIADFGASLAAAQVLHPLAGTPGWQAPEQFFPESRADAGFQYRSDARADLYVLGLLFFHLVTGRTTHFARESLELHRLNPQHAAWAKRQRIDADMQASDRRQFLEALGCTDPADAEVAETWNPGVPRRPPAVPDGAAQAAVALLEKLLQTAPEARPHDIDRVLAHIAELRRAVANMGKPLRNLCGVD